MLRVDYIRPDGTKDKTFELDDGLTLEQAALTLCPETEGKFPSPVVALVGDTPAVKKLGHWNIPLHGAHIQFRALAMGGGGGGGSNPLKMVMQIAIIALAVTAAAFTGGTSLFGIAGVGLGLGTLAGGLAGAAVMMLGTMLMGALCQNRMGIPSGQSKAYDAAQASPTYSINSSGNQIRMYQVEPECFGRMKIVNDYVANTWTQYVANEQIGYFVYAIGRGRYNVESLQFGETVFWKDGKFLDPSYTTSNMEQTVSINANIPENGNYTSQYQAVPNNSLETSTFTFCIHFPDGLINLMSIKPFFRESSREAKCEIQIRKPGNPWISLGVHSWVNKTKNSFDVYVTCSAPYLSNSWEVIARDISEEKDRPHNGRMILKNITTILSLSPIQIEFVDPGNKVTIFPDNVITSDEVSGQQLFAPNEDSYNGTIGPYTTNPAGTTTNRLLLDFVFQNGIGRYNDQGELGNYSVSWRVDYRSVNDAGDATSGWYTLANLSYSDPKGLGTPTPQRLTYTYNVTPGRYQVRAVRTSNTPGDGRTMDVLVWSAMRAMLPGTYTYPISCIAIAIKATNALTQGASNKFASVVTRKLPLYDRETKRWSAEVPTRSWAAAISSVCRSQWGGRLADQNIDLDTLWAIDERLQAKGWYYDAYIDGAYLVWTLLNEMCQSQCVIPRLIGPVLSFVEDKENRPATFALTPRNIVRNTFGITYVTHTDDTPDDVTLDYLDASAGFQQRDVTATLPESESREPASLTILGITNRDHAHDVAVAYAAHNRWQRVVVECQTEALGRLINKGDICTVAHPLFKNTAAGAVTGWNESTLSLILACDMGRLYPEGYEGQVYIALTKPNGGIWGPCLIEQADPATKEVQFDDGDYSTLLLQGHGSPFEWLQAGTNSMPTTWTAYTARNYQRRMVVDEVTSSDGLHYNLKLLNDDARIYQYDTLPTPPWQGRGQLPIMNTLAVPQNMRGIVQSQTVVLLVWEGVAGASWYDVEVSDTGTMWASVGRANMSQMALTVAPGPVYARVRAANDNLTSGWATWQGDSTIQPPVAPEVTAGAYVSGSALVQWDTVENASQYAVNLKHDGTSFYSTTITGTSFQVTPEIQTGGPYRELSINVAAIGTNGTSDESVVTISDPAPEAPQDAVVEIGDGQVSLVSVMPDNATDKTGYVIVRGDTADFGITQLVEMRQVTALPYIWGGLTAGTYYFRIAIKDGFWDVAREPENLNWSAVLTVSIPMTGA